MNISEVTVHSHGAEIKRQGTYTPTQTGTQDIRIDLPPQTAFENGSARAKLQGPVTLLQIHTGYALKTKDEAIESREKPAVRDLYSQLQSKLEQRAKLEAQIDTETSKAENLQQFSEMLIHEKSDFLTVHLSDAMETLETFLDIQAKATDKVVHATLAAHHKRVELARLDRLICKLFTDLNKELNLYRDLTTAGMSTSSLVKEISTHLGCAWGALHAPYICLTVDVSECSPIEVFVSYVSQSCSWQPTYDLRMSSSDLGHVAVEYIGVVTQNSGEDWTDVKLILQTGRPSATGHPPPLGSVTVGFKKPAPPMNTMMVQSRSLAAAPCGAGLFGAAMGAPKVVAQNEGDQAQAAFEFDHTITVPSDNNEHRFEIMKEIVPIKTIHYAVPEMSNEVYRTGVMTNTTQYYFLDCPNATIFWDGALVTHTRVSSAGPGETVRVGLGPEQRVKLDVTPLKKGRRTTGIKLINSCDRELNERSVVLKNLRPDTVVVMVPFRVPITTDAEIKVIVEQPRPGTEERVHAEKDLDLLDNADLLVANNGANPRWMLNEATNNCVGVFTIKPSLTVKADFAYAIEKPTGREVHVVS